MTLDPPIADNPEPIEVPRPAYDVCNSDRLPADRLAFVDGIHQHFLQSFGPALAAYLDTPIEVIPSGVDQLSLGSFLDARNADACVVTLDLAPIRSQAWIGLSAGFVFRVLDVLLGAPQTATPAARTSVTEIEQHVLREFFETLLTTLRNAWAPSGISMRLASVGTAEDVRQTADPDATALILNCKVKLGESEDSFRVAVPVLAVRLAALRIEQNAAGTAAGETAARAALLHAVSDATLQLDAVLQGSVIRLGDLAAMQPGQILVLTQPAGSLLDCLVNGKVKFRGEWIAHGDQHGLQVDSLVVPSPAGKH